MKPKLCTLLLPWLLTMILPLTIQAKVRLPALVGPNMVIQQQTTVNLWGWAQAGKLIRVTTSWDKKTYSVKADAAGNWQVNVTTPIAGGPYTLVFNDGDEVRIDNVLVGEVWVCSGQSNMQMPLKGFNSQPVLNSNELVVNSENPALRLFEVTRATSLTPTVDCKGEWKEAAPATVREFSAVAYQFGQLLQQRLKVPVGIILSSVGGTRIQCWMSNASLRAFPDVSVPASLDTVRIPHREATTLYNGMIAPLIRYGVRGFTWYQGESNSHEPVLYEKLFPAMVNDWRQQWQRGELPFYYVQIAPYAADDRTRNGKRLREAQLKSMAVIPNTGMVSLIDVGMEKSIHPMDKTTPARRLAYWALAKTYGIGGITYCGPVFKSMTIKDQVATLSFDHADYGLTSFGKPLTLFEVAGDDKVFYPATASIKRGTVEVKSEQVAVPVAVRYGYKEFVVGDLFNNDGLPASSFRTDDW